MSTNEELIAEARDFVQLGSGINIVEADRLIEELSRELEAAEKRIESAYVEIRRQDDRATSAEQRATDHAAEALGLRALASEASTETYAANLLAAAQVHATLALAEQQRIANVLAYLDHAEGDEYERLHDDIKKGMGL